MGERPSWRPGRDDEQDGLGRREEALLAVQEAVTIRRQLAATRPDAILPDLATALYNQSRSLSDLERWGEALVAIEEAVTIRRMLATARPRVYNGDLVSSLTILAAALATLGRDSEASEIKAEAAQLR